MVQPELKDVLVLDLYDGTTARTTLEEILDFQDFDDEQRERLTRLAVGESSDLPRGFRCTRLDPAVAVFLEARSTGAEVEDPSAIWVLRVFDVYVEIEQPSATFDEILASFEDVTGIERIAVLEIGNEVTLTRGTKNIRFVRTA